MHDSIAGILGLILMFVGYFLPALIANSRDHRNSTSICLTNLFFGWTFLGWIVALIWAASGNVAQPPAVPSLSAHTPPARMGK